MNRIHILLILLVWILSTNASHSIAEAVFTSLRDGNYSVLKPYLDEDMVKAFSEEKFRVFREDLLSRYGRITGYKFIREDESGEFILNYYSFSFEKANITFKLVIRRINDEYKLSGLWIQEVNIISNGFPIFIAVILTALGGLLGLLIFYTIGFKIEGKELILGFLLVLIVIFIQPIIQQSLFLAFNIKSNIDILAKGAIFIVLSSIWLGFIAGFFQEGLKYIFCRGKNLGNALFIGVGFGLGEAVIIPIIQYIQLIMLGSLPETSLLNSILSMIERFLVTVFHAGTAITLAYSYSKGFGWKTLLALSITHGLIDAFAAYYQLTISQLSLSLSYLLLIASTLILLYYGIPKARATIGFNANWMSDLDEVDRKVLLAIGFHGCNYWSLRENMGIDDDDLRIRLQRLEDREYINVRFDNKYVLTEKGRIVLRKIMNRI